MSELAETLTHKIGPLPTWAWVALGAGAGVLLLRRKQSGAAASTSLGTGAGNLIGSGGGGGGGTGGTVDTGTGTPTTPTTPIVIPQLPTPTDVGSGIWSTLQQWGIHPGWVFVPAGQHGRSVSAFCDPSYGACTPIQPNMPPELLALFSAGHLPPAPGASAMQSAQVAGPGLAVQIPAWSPAQMAQVLSSGGSGAPGANQ